MSLFNVYDRKSKRTKLNDLLEENVASKEQCCSPPRTPAKPPPLQVYVRKQNGTKLALPEKDRNLQSVGDSNVISRDQHPSSNGGLDSMGMIDLNINLDSANFDPLNGSVCATLEDAGSTTNLEDDQLMQTQIHGESSCIHIENKDILPKILDEQANNYIDYKKQTQKLPKRKPHLSAAPNTPKRPRERKPTARKILNAALNTPKRPRGRKPTAKATKQLKFQSKNLKELDSISSRIQPKLNIKARSKRIRKLSTVEWGVNFLQLVATQLDSLQIRIQLHGDLREIVVEDVMEIKKMQENEKVQMIENQDAIKIAEEITQIWNKDCTDGENGQLTEFVNSIEIENKDVWSEMENKVTEEQVNTDSKKRRQKPKRKKHRPRVVIDELNGKRAKPKVYKSRPCTPKQSKEGKSRQTSKQVRKSSQASKSSPGISNRPRESKTPKASKHSAAKVTKVAKQLNFQSENLEDADSVTFQNLDMDSIPKSEINNKVAEGKGRRTRSKRKRKVFNIKFVAPKGRRFKRIRRGNMPNWLHQVVGMVEEKDVKDLMKMEMKKDVMIENPPIQMIENRDAITEEIIPMLKMEEEKNVKEQIENPPIQVIENQDAITEEIIPMPKIEEEKNVKKPIENPSIQMIKDHDSITEEIIPMPKMEEEKNVKKLIENPPIQMIEDHDAIMEEIIPMLKMEEDKNIKNPKMKKVKNVKVQKNVSQRQIDLLIRRMKSLHVSDELAMILYKRKKKKIIPKVDLDANTLKLWNILQISDKVTDEDDKWETEREIFARRVSLFNHVMYQIQGDRGFRKWKGSVIDSVVGVFLTQNVSDFLSSGAFMSLVSRFPSQTTRPKEESVNLEGNKYFVSQPETEPVEIEPTSDASDSESEITEDIPILPEELIRGIGLDNFDWDGLRIKYSAPRNSDQMDAVDWEAVRTVNVEELANTIKERGQHRQLATKIQAFLNKVLELHKSLDLEWLRRVPPDLAKEYLISFRGLGLKSVECVRLLCLQNVAFPVDTNVGRIAVRLGWVPLRPLPDQLQMHLLEMYPLLDSVQKYLWPRLCKLDQQTLYQLHYQMITFGKVFCSKRSPNCNACPLRTECKHFASAFASANALPAPKKETVVNSFTEAFKTIHPYIMEGRLSEPIIEEPFNIEDLHGVRGSEPIIEEPFDIEDAPRVRIIKPNIVEPFDIEDVPGIRFSKPNSVEQFDIEDVPGFRISKSNIIAPFDFEDVSGVKIIKPNIVEQLDIEDCPWELEDEEFGSKSIPFINLNMEAWKQNLYNYMNVGDGDVQNSTALVALNSETVSIPQKLKNFSRLRTEHLVYELPRDHPLIKKLQLTPVTTKEEHQYHLAIWRPGELPNSQELSQSRCNSTDIELCNDQTCYSCNNIREQNLDIVRATILIPTRVAMRETFPLNGTYFQVNEVFADHETSYHPVYIPRKLIYNLRRKKAYFGSSTSAITRGLSTREIQECFWRGIVCFRGFERRTGAPRNLVARLHRFLNKKVNGSSSGKNEINRDRTKKKEGSSSTKDEANENGGEN